MDQKTYFIRAERDDEANVWFATSDDVPGLATESETLEGLHQKLQSLVPELLKLNGVATAGEVAFDLVPAAPGRFCGQ